MKTAIPNEINTKEDVEKFFRELFENGEMYNPDDLAETVINDNGRLFTDEESKALNQAMRKCWNIATRPRSDFDLHELAMKISGTLPETDDRFWDCECNTDYIHVKSEQTFCRNCQKSMQDMPDSRKSEIPYLKPGCYFDSVMGDEENCRRIIKLAKDTGFVLCDSNNDGLTEDEILEYDTEAAIEFLQNFSPDGYYVNWHEGDFGVWPIEEEKVGDVIEVKFPSFYYDGNANENYYVFKNGRVFIELFADEDKAIALVALLNKHWND